MSQPADPNPTLFKLAHVYWVVPALSAGLMAAYSVLDWLLVARNGVLPLDADLVAFWLPGGLAVVLALLFVQRRLNRLQLNERRNIPFLYFTVAAAAIALPTIVAQTYVSEAAGELTVVADGAAIASAPVTKFYATRTLCLSRGAVQVQPVVSTSGRSNDLLHFTFFVVVPVCAANAPQRPEERVWIGLTYEKSLSSRISDAEREAAFKAFADETQKAFDAEDPAAFRFLQRVGNGAARRDFEKALGHGGIDPAGVTILRPHKEAFDQRTGDSLIWAAGSFAAFSLVWLVMVLVAPLNPAQPQFSPSSSGGESEDSAFNPWDFVVPRRESYGLPLLIDVNIAVFVAMVLAGLGLVSFQADDLLAWGAAYRPAIEGVGILRLFTSQFVHGGLMHLAGNLYGLVITGLFLAPVARNGRLILLYLLGGLGGSLASVAWHPATVSVGASGAIFGLCGILLSLLALNDSRVADIRRFALTNIGIFVAYNLAFGAVASGIDNAAHVGGLLTGLVLGAILFALGGRSGHLSE